MSSAGAALLFSALAQYATATARDTELASEAVCWVVLPALVELRRRSRSWGTDGATSATLFSRASSAVTSTRVRLFALGVAAACLYRAEENVVTLYPALTPLLLLSGVGPSASILTDSRLFWPQLNAIWSSILIAALSCLALLASNLVRLPALAVCVVVVSLLYGGYFAISRTPSYVQVVDTEDLGGKQEHDDIAVGMGPQDEALPLAFNILPLLAAAMGIRIFILHKPNGSIIALALAGVLKALSWFFTLEATRYSSWCIASTIGTFAIASTGDHSLTGYSSYLQAISHSLASLASLAQTIHMIPKHTKLRSALWVFSIFTLMPFLATIYAINKSPVPLQPDIYPVEALAYAAEARFAAMLQRQSRSYAAAALEYRRRYGLEPPPGFEAWYDYAVAHDSPIIDEFDMIHKNLAPFWKISGVAVREAVKEAGEKSGIDLWTCEFKAATRETHCTHPSQGDAFLGPAFRQLLGAKTVQLPDIVFLVNYLDEPRVMLPGVDSASNERIRLSDMSGGSVWETVVKSCYREARATSTKEQGGSDVKTYDMPFVADTGVDKDLCRHPEYREMHGLVMSPASFPLVDGAVPVLSSATLSTMGDIIYPGPHHITNTFAYDQVGDIEWDKKSNNLYWAGSTTGGVATGSDDRWKKFHRQRFVALAQGLEKERTEYWYLREQHGSLYRVASSNISSKLFDVAFTGVTQCSSAVCESEHAYFDVRPRADPSAALASKLVFDLDGNSFSGRFIRLLASRSAVLKQTLLREWHDERLAAWVHYLPVSQGLGELPELVTWLMSTDEGQRRAKAVADRGREWALKATRPEDMEIYVYRLLLELARILDPKRKAT